MSTNSSRGFTLVELAITVLVMGLLLTFTIPALSSFSQTLQLQGAAQNIAGQLRLAREKAIGTGATQTMHFTAGFMNSDYHIHNGAVGPGWSLPNGITYYWGGGTISSVTMSTDGRAQNSGYVILQNRKGAKDTVSVQLSGLVLTK